MNYPIYKNRILQINMINHIGLNKKESRLLSKKLNLLLSNYQLFYINTRGFHWNIKGEKFFELHLKFEELYNDALIKIDEIAERVLTLGENPVHTFSDYLEIASIKEAKDISNGKEAVKNVLNSFDILLKIERDVLKIASKAGDEGTNSMMSDYILQQEKLVWMYQAYMS